jgi:hypothetical protein
VARRAATTLDADLSLPDALPTFSVTMYEPVADEFSTDPAGVGEPGPTPTAWPAPAGARRVDVTTNAARPIWRSGWWRFG